MIAVTGARGGLLAARRVAQRLVARLTGRRPISLAESLRDNPDSYRHLLTP